VTTLLFVSKVCDIEPEAHQSDNGIQVPITWTFAYGPNGNAVLAKSAFQGGASDTATLHWDGGNLLFITDQATGLSVVSDRALRLGDFDTAGYTSSTDGYALKGLSP
jgi:hypothetical protein